MNQATIAGLSIAVSIAVLIGTTAFVSSRVRRASRVATRDATRSGVSFIVCARRWQSVMMRVVGILFIAVGGFLLLVAIVPSSSSSARGAAIPGVVIALVGILFVWIARGLSRARLEVTPDSVWIFRFTGQAREVPVRDISRLTALGSNNYGGVVAHLEHGRSFSATRLMLGYPQLIDYLQTRRPDLPIPDASQPM